MAFLKKIGRGHGITIDHDLSVGLSRDSFLFDQVYIPPLYLRFGEADIA